MGSLGYLCPDYPEEFGGGGLGKIAECIMVEEVAKVCSGIASGILTQSGLATRIIAMHGNEKQKEEYLIPAVKGEKIASFGLTESEAGSDAANIQTTAVNKGDQYILNGGKIYITNGQYCDYAVVAAVTDKSQGARGIGKGISARLAQQGATVVILDILDEEGKKTVSEIEGAKGKAKFYHCDVTKKEQVDRDIAVILKDFGQIDILVNNAGYDKMELFLKLDPSWWDKLIALNYKHFIYTNYAVLSHMRDRNYGRIINIASDEANYITGQTLSGGLNML